MGYRTIEQAYEIIHEFDNGSAITKYFLRMFITFAKRIL